MADKMNMELSDEMLANAAGGLAAGAMQKADYDAMGKVVMHRGGRKYQVSFDDGAELFATSRSDEIVPEGTVVGLFAVAGGWTMEVPGD